MSEEDMFSIIERIKVLRVEQGMEEVKNYFCENFNVAGDIYSFIVVEDSDSLPLNENFFRIYMEKARFLYDISIYFDVERKVFVFKYVANQCKINSIKENLIV